MKVAVLQMRVAPGDESANMARAKSLVADAAKSGANLALLPEAFHLGWTDPSARDLADSVPNGRVAKLLSQWAVEQRIYLCAGIVERAGDRIFNAAALFSPQGSLLLHHRKINELDIAAGLYARGDRIQVCETEFGRIGLMICADAFAEGRPISRALGAMGAKVILSPCSWAVTARDAHRREPYGQLWLDNYIPVAQEYQLSIVAASNVGPITAGPWQGRVCIGSSMAVDPHGEEIARATYGAEAEEILHVMIA
ncbi:MAG TPA: carbon-nitrogen hydrolase family protein [Methylomirabilota bacterium]|nr:carbon-nitrogen hydrolase family protein [Methylomirabilota bacterium]